MGFILTKQFKKDHKKLKKEHPKLVSKLMDLIVVVDVRYFTFGRNREARGAKRKFNGLFFQTNK
jgi:hypothetical protein